MKYPNLWGMLFNAPLMVHEPVAQHFVEMFVLIQQQGLAAAQAAAAQAVVPQPHAYADNVAPGQRFRSKAYTVTEAGIAVMPIHGVLVQRAGQIATDCTELASYQRLGATLRAMVADADVRGILLEVDSPGGQVAGNFELAGDIQAAREKKPVWAHANVMAFSGGYSLLASAERAYAPMDGLVGSIGVIMQHVSQAEKDRKAGYEYTTIKAGARKDAFDPHKPLSKADLEWAQALVDRNRDMFAQVVATGRKLDIKAVLDTEAGIYAATEGKALGLIDDIATFSETLAAFEQRLNAGPAFIFTPVASSAAQPISTHPKEPDMSGTAPAASQPGAAPATPQPTATAPVAPAPAATAPAATAPAAPDANASGTAERTRISGILTSPEAKGREGLANHIAFNTDMSVEAAKAMLAASPLGATANALATAMNQVPNPKVGVDAPGSGEPAKPTISTTGIYEARAKAAATYR